MEALNNKVPTVSIIMPAYQAESTIQESINCIISQTYSDWELIIVYDTSPDRTEELIKIYCEKDPRITAYTQAQKMGVAGSRNMGINKAKGEWIALLDSDDLWTPDKLEKQLRCTIENNAEISYTATAYVRNGIRSAYVLRARQSLSYKTLLRQNIMSCSSVMVKRSIISRYPFCQGQGLKDFAEDFAVWLKILRDEVPYAFGLDEPLLIYRMNYSSRGGRLLKTGIMTFYTYRHIGCGLLTSMLFTLRYSIKSISKRLSINKAMQTVSEDAT